MDAAILMKGPGDTRCRVSSDPTIGRPGARFLLGLRLHKEVEDPPGHPRLHFTPLSVASGVVIFANAAWLTDRNVLLCCAARKDAARARKP